MKKETVTINVDFGVEAQSVAMLVQVANRYDSKLYVETANKKVNLKSIMGVMSIGLRNGDQVVVEADGGDEDQALNEVGSYLKCMAY